MPKRDVFDEVLASAPQGAVAAKVTGRGTHYEPDVNFACVEHFDAPPPMTSVPKCPQFVDFTGARFGRLTVVGLGRPDGNGKSGRWVVRCACGDFEYRRTAAIKRALEREHCEARCKKCEHWEIVRKRYERLGGRAVEEMEGERF
jgi:hypothetical protein